MNQGWSSGSWSWSWSWCWRLATVGHDQIVFRLEVAACGGLLITTGFLETGEDWQVARGGEMS